MHHVILDPKAFTVVTACDRLVKVVRAQGDTAAPVKVKDTERTLARRNLCPECQSTLRVLTLTPEQQAHAWLLGHLSPLAPFSDADLVRLAADLAAVQAEEFPGHADHGDAFDEWLRRIGGQRNLPSYAACLAAGDARRARQ